MDMEENATYNEVLKKVAEAIVGKKIEVSLNSYKDNFNVSVFVNDGDKKDSVYNGFFYTGDSDRVLEAKCAGFVAAVECLAKR